MAFCVAQTSICEPLDSQTQVQSPLTKVFIAGRLPTGLCWVRIFALEQFVQQVVACVLNWGWMLTSIGDWMLTSLTCSMVSNISILGEKTRYSYSQSSMLPTASRFFTSIIRQGITGMQAQDLSNAAGRTLHSLKLKLNAKQKLGWL